MGKAFERMMERRKARMAADDRRQRLLFVGIAVAIVLGLGVLFIRKRIESGPLDVNKATAAQLEKLPGIGPETAKDIIRGRPYQTAQDLLNVKGIGPKTVEKIQDRLKFPDGAAAAPTSP